MVSELRPVQRGPATPRTTPQLWIGETAAIGAYIGAAYWFTSSTSFANPAVTIGRAFTDTFAGISPASVPGFVAFQLVGAAAGLGLVVLLYPQPKTVTDHDTPVEPPTLRVPARSR